MSDSASKARRLLAAALRLPADALPVTASIGALEAWDSLAHVRLMLAIEEAVGRNLTSDEIVGVSGLADIAALLDHAVA